MADAVCGIISEIIYTNEENGYTVCQLQSDDESFTVVGFMPFLAVGDTIEAQGKWTTHLEYGEQFKVEYYTRRLPEGKEAVLLYLSSGAIKGVKESTAKKIVNMFGERSLEVIQNTPELLCEIRGITKDRAAKIHEQYLQQLSMQSLIAFFGEYGISSSYAFRAYTAFGPEAMQLVKNNPYILCEIDGIGFKSADKIAFLMGGDEFGEKRVRAATLYAMSLACGDGHTFLPKPELSERVCRLLGVSEDMAQSAVTQLLLDGKLRLVKSEDTEEIYLPPLYTAQTGCAIILKQLAEKKSDMQDIDIDEEIKSFGYGITLAPMQRKAVENAVYSHAAVITGGPGTGKTTIIKAVIDIFTRHKISVALCAPTGRAAKRMSELCGCEAKTVHRLLECGFSAQRGKTVFARNSSNPIDEEVIIIDEMSMVDISLMYQLLSAMPQNGRIVMVGDSDQLPSVGPGNVLRDIVASGVIKTVVLSEIFRQAQQSRIVVNAHSINAGNLPEYDNKTGDFFVLRRPLVRDGINEVISLCTKRLPSYLGVDPLSGVQVIMPSRRGDAGVESVNTVLQNVFNPQLGSKTEIRHKAGVLRVGDKIMQIKNNYDLAWETDSGDGGMGIFNGDIGIISSIDKKSGFLNILFDGEKHTLYPMDFIDDLDLAYAVTVHKSQGSEFDAVIIMLYPSHRNLLSRNLLYTAVTRAKRFVVVVGREDVMKFMCENNHEALRYSSLQKLLSSDII